MNTESTQYQSLANFLYFVDEMQAELPQLKDVHSLIEQADQLEERHSYHSAREVYKEAVSILLPLIESKHIMDNAYLIYFYCVIHVHVY